MSKSPRTYIDAVEISSDFTSGYYMLKSFVGANSEICHFNTTDRRYTLVVGNAQRLFFPSHQQAGSQSADLFLYQYVAEKLAVQVDLVLAGPPPEEGQPPEEERQLDVSTLDISTLPKNELMQVSRGEILSTPAKQRLRLARKR